MLKKTIPISELLVTICNHPDTNSQKGRHLTHCNCLNLREIFELFKR